MHNGYWRDDWSGWWWIPMSLVMLVFWVGLAVLVVVLVRQAQGNGAARRPPYPPPPYPQQPYPPVSTHPEDPTAGARRILAERLASGDIDLDDYRHRLEALGTAGSATNRPPS